MMCDQPMVRRQGEAWETCDCPSRGYKPLRFDDLNELLRKIKMQAQAQPLILRREVEPARQAPKDPTTKSTDIFGTFFWYPLFMLGGARLVIEFLYYCFNR